MNNVVFDFESLPEEHKNKEVILYEWIVPQGDWVEEEQPLYVLLVGKATGKIGKAMIEKANFSGVVEHFLQTNDVISPNVPVARLYSKGNYISENLLEDEVFFSHFNRFNYSDELFFGNWFYRIESWRVKDGDWVEKGQLLLSLHFRNRSIMDNDKSEDRFFHHFAERSGFFYKESGYLKERFHVLRGLTQGDKLYRIQDDLHKVKIVDKVKKKIIQKEGYKNVPKITYDPFVKSKIIKWQYVGSSLWNNHGVKSYSKEKGSLSFSFNSYEGSDFIVFQFSSKQFMLRSGDTVSFLFSDDSVIDFVLDSESYLFKESNRTKIFENKIKLTTNELDKFKNVDFENWRINLEKTSQSFIGGEVGQNTYLTKEEMVSEIKQFAKQYSELVAKEISNYKPLEDRQELENSSSYDSTECYVYLMVDTSNNFHKIGISNSPDYRERTLQSEKPTIELLAAKKFVNRDIASSFEKALHSTYESKRLRGEWFELEENEISDLITTLND